MLKTKGALLSEADVRSAMREDMMREIILAANEHLEELSDAIDNQDWQDELRLRNRLTTRIMQGRERR